MTAFGDDGFSTGTDGTAGNLLNYSTDPYVAWAWLAGTAFSNDASATGVGTIDSSGEVNNNGWVQYYEVDWERCIWCNCCSWAWSNPHHSLL